ncbi:MAG: putative phytochrome sensor protein [Pedosphaera sp.]|nr:putative phytochrome sensor protein [Pedosphaera sp.]
MNGLSQKEPPIPRPNRRPSYLGGSIVLTLWLVVAALYFAREVFIPLALAVLFSFLLAPLVDRLRRWHLGRVPSVLIAVLFAFGVLGFVGEVMTGQMVDLVHKLPGYQENIRKKLQSIGAGDGGAVGRVTKSFEELRQSVMPRKGAAPAQPQGGQNAAQQPVPVEVKNTSFSPLQVIRTIVGSLVSMMVTAFVVIVFVIFMLIERDDLRDRLIRLIGTGKLKMTTQLLDDASHRVSRYLLMQLIVNVGYGIPIGIGLYFIGIPNPLMWGLLTALLRYIPYAGAWIAASMPFAVAIAVDPGWTKPLLVVGLYSVVEIIVANFVEPLVYGSYTGVTPLAILLAAVVWAWLWGPVGLLLATPLTVCLVSLGRYIPNLGFLYILLGDEPVLSPAARFYQRMLAMNEQEATDLAEAFLKDHSLQELYDEMIIPALVMAEQDCQRGVLDDEHHAFLLQNTRFLVDDMADLDPETKRHGSEQGNGRHVGNGDGAGQAPDLSALHAVVFSLAARNEADEITAIMLSQVLQPHGVETRILAAPALTPEKREMIRQEKACVVCISAVPPPGLLSARQTARRLRHEFPDLQIVVGLWGAKQGVEECANRLSKIPPDNVVTTLKQAMGRILALISEPAGQEHPPMRISG